MKLNHFVIAGMITFGFAMSAKAQIDDIDSDGVPDTSDNFKYLILAIGSLLLLPAVIFGAANGDKQGDPRSGALGS